MTVATRYRDDAEAVLFHGDCRELLRRIPRGAARLVVTSPPYNNGKAYETKVPLAAYLREQAAVIRLCTSRLTDGGSICWQVGNHILPKGVVYPLDILLFPYFARLGLSLRNRIVWHFGHGLHSRKRLSGRHETILWFTKGDDYIFHLDPIRVPQKYPGKRHYKGPNNKRYSGNPGGKNPGDVWAIPNVKYNHVEKTFHPCQFPVELVERLILALTDEGDLVVDPYMGVGTTAIAARRHGRRVAGAEVCKAYYHLALERLASLEKGTLRIRPMWQQVYEPDPRSALATRLEAHDA